MTNGPRGDHNVLVGSQEGYHAQAAEPRNTIEAAMNAVRFYGTRPQPATLLNERKEQMARELEAHEERNRVLRTELEQLAEVPAGRAGAWDLHQVLCTWCHSPTEPGCEARSHRWDGQHPSITRWCGLESRLGDEATGRLIAVLNACAFEAQRRGAEARDDEE